MRKAIMVLSVLALSVGVSVPSLAQMRSEMEAAKDNVADISDRWGVG